MKKIFLILTLALSASLSLSCEDAAMDSSKFKISKDVVLTQNLLSSNYVGNGAQWGGYESISDWLGGENNLSDEDWAKLFERVDYMRPPFIRIMVNQGSYMDGDTFDATLNVPLMKILEYCQSRNIEVTFGEWGHAYTDALTDIDPEWVANSVKFVDYLLNTKGFSCIKTLNIINEPNGDWATTQGSYEAWSKTQELYLAEMVTYGITTPLMGPDIAIFEGTSELSWFTNAVRDFDANIGLYDLHVYPKQQIVRNGDYTDMLKAYKAVLPANKRVVLGEVGFKYTEVDADLKQENEDAIAADEFAGEDSNMMIYKGFYGVDMADAMIQSMMAGYSGAMIWMMDDAMYVDPEGNDYTAKKLKRWGFWNILGEELCNDAEDEEIRPYFYTASLLCRYFPAGSNIYEVELPNKKGLRAILGEKGGKYTLAVVNSHYVTYDITLKSDAIKSLTADYYYYKSNADGSYVGAVDGKGFAVPAEAGKTYNFERGEDITIEGESFVLFTNME